MARRDAHSPRTASASHPRGRFRGSALRGSTFRGGAFRGGATILEMALTLGILLNLTFGTIEFGYFFFVKNTVQGAAREGARAAIPPGAANTDVTKAVNGALTAAGLKTSDFTTTVKVNGVAANAGTAVAGQQLEVA